MESFYVGRIMLKRFGHLNGQFTSGRQCQNLDVLVLHVDVGQQRQGECCCLAGARGRMPQNVLAIH